MGGFAAGLFSTKTVAPTPIPTPRSTRRAYSAYTRLLPFLRSSADGPVCTGPAPSSRFARAVLTERLGSAQLLCRECRGLLGDGSGSSGVVSVGIGGVVLV